MLCIRNVKYRIHSGNVYTSVLFTFAKIISKAKNPILFPYCLHRYFSSWAYWSLSSTRFFWTFILLSSRFVKKLTSKIFKFRGDTKDMALNRQGRWKGFSTRGWGVRRGRYHKKGHLGNFSNKLLAPHLAYNIFF